jgi:hypothetical protein
MGKAVTYVSYGTDGTIDEDSIVLPGPDTDRVFKINSFGVTEQRFLF